jgi:hypothetical protein
VIISCTHQQGVAVAGVEQCRVLDDVERLCHLQGVNQTSASPGSAATTRHVCQTTSAGVKGAVDTYKLT